MASRGQCWDLQTPELPHFLEFHQEKVLPAAAHDPGKRGCETHTANWEKTSILWGAVWSVSQHPSPGWPFRPREAATKNSTSPWMESTVFSSARTLPAEQGRSTPGPGGELGGSRTWALEEASVPTATSPLSEANGTAAYPQSLQDQCWETYVGQIPKSKFEFTNIY
ncbi:hypothetical protein MC885_017511 [Smutsia gigantea]|nr:hypothetical protein MC885_017511 [Smutsia gigantea]